MANGMSDIENLIVLMMENRSFDNLLGWLYGPDNPPKQIIGGSSSDPSFYGLTAANYWNPSNASYFQGQQPDPVDAIEGTTDFTVPSVDPEEYFDHMNFQLFGTKTPTDNQVASMLGFLVDYENVNSSDATSIMQTYSTSQVSMLSGLASNFAVSDQWYASAPCQTWPNRAFVHTGTSCGRVNNWPYDPYDFDVPTIFNVLEACGHSWAVYNPGIFESLTRLQLPQLWHLSLDSHFQGMSDFFEQTQNGTLPTYSFLEPDFLIHPDDEHPPHDVCLGEQYLQTIYSAVVNGANWEHTLFIITFDEHGGCADHVPTPWGAATPDEKSNPGEENFYFNRFGVRVPTVFISPWVEEGTVFRSTTSVPYDHTSILATIQSWLDIPADKMLASNRIAAAPTFDGVLNAPSARTDVPDVSPSCTPSLFAPRMTAPLNDLQKSMVAAMVRKAAGQRVSMRLVEKVLATINTRERAAKFLAT